MRFWIFPSLNFAFPRQNDIYALACKIFTRLGPLNMATYTLRDAFSLATNDQRLLYEDIVQHTLNLSDLKRQAPLHPVVERRITSTIAGALRAKVTRTDSLLSDHFVDRSRLRHLDEPSSGRGAPKRAAIPFTLDNASTLPPRRTIYRRTPGKYTIEYLTSGTIGNRHRRTRAAPP